MAIGAIVVANIFKSSFDIRTITTSNDFITSMLHSDAVVGLTDQAKTYVAYLIAAIGCCFGILAFGIGMVLSRLRVLAKKVA